MRPALTGRQVNLVLELLLVLSIGTGFGSWVVPIDWARPFTAVHAVAGVAVLLLAPLKIRGPVRSGFRRARPERWLSTGFGFVVLAAIGLGVLHATGAWYGIGPWSALWLHLLAGFSAIPLLVWHVWSRPIRPTTVDFGRRAVLSAATVAAGAVAVVIGKELTIGAVGAAGADRAGTGSHDLASFDPAAMPVVSWFDDRTPAIANGSITIEARSVDVAAIAATTSPVTATLDCTGGWRSTQSWDAVSLAAVLGDRDSRRSGRSVRVTSSTGYSRLFALDAAHDIYLCTGYGGEPLRAGHGGPVRVVAPGRRGPWWVKWVERVEVTDRPAWLQLPLPPT